MTRPGPMQRLLRDVPIARKLTFIIMLSSGLALLLACSSLIAYEWSTDRDELVDDLMTTAQMLGDNSAAALLFGDSASAEQTLGTLSATSHVIGAALYDRSGELFGTYYRSGTPEGLAFVPPRVASERVGFVDGAVEAFRRIDVSGEQAGTIYIRSSLTELGARMRRYVLITLGVMLVATLGAFVVATRLQRVIVEPVAHLSSVVGLVSAEKNYAVRAVRTGDDELGRLIDGFNGMLDQIQSRDAALEAARGGLERRVSERTAELQLEVAERRQAEAALRSSEERFSSAFKHASIGMALATPEGQFIKVNRALFEMLGYSEAELLERTFVDITHAEDRDSGQSAARKLLAGEVTHHQVEKRYLHKDGHAVWAQVSISLVFDAGGKPLIFIAQILDISERKRAEAQLEESHRQLLEVSRQSGMAEVATSVLHNVGNVLNSVNVSASVAVETVKNSRAASMTRVVDLLREHRADLGSYITADPKGLHIPAVLEQLSKDWLREQALLGKELEGLRANIDHIKGIVAMQQSYAKVSGTSEIVDLRELIEDCLRMDQASLARHNVQVVREFAEVAPVTVEKHKVLQILVNLVRNAVQACTASGRADRRLTLGLHQADGRIRISVSDNGIGIAPENLTRIFAHGFTTRTDGHGFGLHSGALAARELGGSLSAHSDGPGQGATFTLDLPAQPTGKPS